MNETATRGDLSYKYMKEYLIATNAREDVRNQAKQVSRYFKDNLMASYTIRDSETIEHRIVYNWPLTAFEEPATNCILHKQCESPNCLHVNYSIGRRTVKYR